MPAKQQDKVLLTCPHCGGQQSEPRAVISTICRQCRRHFRAGDIPKSTPASPDTARDLRRVNCFECATLLEVAVNAQSTMCKRCSAHIDLRDYQINNAVSRNFRTKGRFVIEPKGYVFNTEAIVGDAIIRGRFLGKLVAERSLTVFSSTEIKGSFRTARLEIPEGHHFRWPAGLWVGGADIAGELVTNLESSGTIILRSTARHYGNLQTARLVVEEGAVVMGELRIGSKFSVPSPPGLEIARHS